MNCPICFADSNVERFDPDAAQICHMLQTALHSNPFCSVQLSGGEPTVREDLPEIIRMAKDMGVIHLQVNTNGLKLAADKAYARTLKAAGCDLVLSAVRRVCGRISTTIPGDGTLVEVKLAANKKLRECWTGGVAVPEVTLV
jgi:uncharacterized radical SAM superfamily Fe-S cluster-containing enzyme